MGKSQEESVKWLTQAQDEFADADELRKRGRFYLALFHFQQAAEKALKAYLYAMVKSKEIFTTHSLENLLAMAREMDPDFRAVTDAKGLDKYSIRTRYPDALHNRIPSRYFVDPQEATEAMEITKELVDLVVKKMNGMEEK